MKQSHQHKQALAALLLNTVTFLAFVLPRVDLSARTLSGWGFNLLALIQLMMIAILLVRLIKKPSN